MRLSFSFSFATQCGRRRRGMCWPGKVAGGEASVGVAVMLTQLLRISYDVIRRSLGFFFLKWKKNMP